jgi:hypothetical protein
VFSLAINHAGLSCHRAQIENSRTRKFADAPAVCPGGEPCQSSRCHHSRRNFASTICGRGFSDRGRRHIFYETGFVNFRDRVHERIADLAKKLWRAFAGRFARTVTERQLSLHFISGRNAHSHRRDGEFQTRAGTAGGGNKRPDRALLFEWNVCSVTGIGHRAALEKNLRHDWKTVVIFGNDQ